MSCGVCVYTQLCPNLCDPMDCSPLGSSVHGILQARTLEWVSMPPQKVFPTQGLNPCLIHPLHWQVGSLPLAPPGKPTGRMPYKGEDSDLGDTFTSQGRAKMASKPPEARIEAWNRICLTSLRRVHPTDY